MKNQATADFYYARSNYFSRRQESDRAGRGRATTIREKASVGGVGLEGVPDVRTGQEKGRDGRGPRPRGWRGDLSEGRPARPRCRFGDAQIIPPPEITAGTRRAVVQAAVVGWVERQRDPPAPVRPPAVGLAGARPTLRPSHARQATCPCITRPANAPRRGGPAVAPTVTPSPSNSGPLSGSRQRSPYAAIRVEVDPDATARKGPEQP